MSTSVPLSPASVTASTRADSLAARVVGVQSEEMPGMRAALLAGETWTVE